MSLVAQCLRGSDPVARIKIIVHKYRGSSPAGTSLEANLKHITVTLATWDAVWEVYLDPKWAQQRLRLYGAQDRTLEQFFKKEEDREEVSMQRHGRAKQLVVFFGAAGIGTRGGWGTDAVLRGCCKVVCRPRSTDQRRGRVVLVDEHRTTRVSSAVNGQQPLAPREPPQAPGSSQEATQAAASEPGPSTPPPAKRSKRTKAEPAAEPNKGTGKAAEAKPAPQPGRWLYRNCNAALNMQRIGESRWRPLELCYWPEQGKLPAKGKEYPGLGYKRVRDKPLKAQQQQPAEAQDPKHFQLILNWLRDGWCALPRSSDERAELLAELQYYQAFVPGQHCASDQATIATPKEPTAAASSTTAPYSTTTTQLHAMEAWVRSKEPTAAASSTTALSQHFNGSPQRNIYTSGLAAAARPVDAWQAPSPASARQASLREAFLQATAAGPMPVQPAAAAMPTVVRTLLELAYSAPHAALQAGKVRPGMEDLDWS
ncbi:hypothetical protein QJQ45_004278 [Haematococcus lacustris]|nr:hypothetical protein QJQ45_004278 [Haematococcus lacustris]